MAYSKPKTVAKSAAKSSFVAGCPEKGMGSAPTCKKCERTR